MAESRIGKLLLDAAARDAVVLEKLCGDADVHDSILGFHAQQAIEKALKAVLVHAGIELRRTHDIAELLDAFADHGVALPPHADRVDELNPFAVAARYGILDPGPLDRQAARVWVRETIAWAGARLAM